MNLNKHDTSLTAEIEALPESHKHTVGACGAMFTRMIAGVEERASVEAAGLAARLVRAILDAADEVRADEPHTMGTADCVCEEPCRYCKCETS